MENKITDKNGINYLIKKPNQGQYCQIKIRGNKGFHSEVQYINGHFETTEIHSNRTVITRWKADLWLPITKLDCDCTKKYSLYNKIHENEECESCGGVIEYQK